MLLFEDEFCLENEVLCFPLKKVVFLLRPVDRLASKARDRLHSLDVKDEVVAFAPSLACWDPVLESLFCRLKKTLERLLLASE